MGLRDAYHDLVANQVIAPILCSNDATGNVANTVDLEGYSGGLIGVQTGVEGDLFDANNYMTIKWQTSTNNVGWSAANDADLIGGNNTAIIDANADANSTHTRSYIGSKRYVRVEFQATAGAVSLPVSAHIVRSKPIRA